MEGDEELETAITEGGVSETTRTLSYPKSKHK